MSDFILVILIAIAASCYIAAIAIVAIGCCSELQRHKDDIKARQEALKERQDVLMAGRKYKDLTKHFGENI